jgi:hypothetical protein
MSQEQKGIKRPRHIAAPPSSAPASPPGDPQWLDDFERDQLGTAIEVVQRLPFDDPANARCRVAGCLLIATHLLAVASRFAEHYHRPTKKIVSARYAVAYALSEARAGTATPEAA